MVITNFTMATQVWKKEVFGNLRAHKRRVIARIRGVQAAIDKRRTRNLRKLECKLGAKLERILELEELTWLQPSRIDWVVHGDRNTKFYHHKVMSRLHQNRIEGLKLDNDEWCFDEAVLKQAIVKYFLHIYSMDDEVSDILPDLGLFLAIKERDLDRLCTYVTDVEVNATLGDGGWSNAFCLFICFMLLYHYNL